ncbi:MAG: preprotein translocase subunit SecY [Candidatus Magasanikbacteria bacterium CG10_big_fil_rev_8_21_14_0_10_43_6]|uniref:Protein translocase subunit SecY n=1 Tax=Candidatus Magasanikbacteria bacterium CG10_big_fil_rev_8_21_14_0_10_43_6 TaxID=1974650 RepID=A0A2M6W084_9BACT|nr:MAG: preprotein translocase subunit SecY [Candidatus Magasanikbacteria bacterium CG10_big_fil_rev_8_21_14_0_10_43_6]
MWQKILHIWNIKDLRKSIVFVLSMLVVFRVAAHIPVPGVNTEGLKQFLEGNQILGLLNIFSGGTLENFSIVMLGVAPYITSSIIFQLLQMVVPQLEELRKEGDSGQQKIQIWTRLTSVPLAILQSFGLIQLLSQSQSNILTNVTPMTYVSIILTTLAGTIFLMWIGELITEKRIGNGISLLIFAGIIAALPRAAQTAIVNYNPSDLYIYLLFVAAAILTVVAVVIVNEGQRNIPVNYAKRMSGGKSFGGAESYLPLRVNTAGVIPIIFAISVILFPPMIAQFFINSAGLVGRIALFIVNIFQNQVFYSSLYFILVFGFTYFYTAVIFQPQKVAENLQRQGGFIPGIRPGKETEAYLGKIMNRLVFSGASFLGLIAVLPFILQAVTGTQALAIGGTSLLIVVSVAIDIAKQIEAQVTLHEYDRA